MEYTQEQMHDLNLRLHRFASPICAPIRELVSKVGYSRNVVNDCLRNKAKDPKKAEKVFCEGQILLKELELLYPSVAKLPLTELKSNLRHRKHIRKNIKNKEIESRLKYITDAVLDIEAHIAYLTPEMNAGYSDAWFVIGLLEDDLNSILTALKAVKSEYVPYVEPTNEK